MTQIKKEINLGGNQRKMKKVAVIIFSLLICGLASGQNRTSIYELKDFPDAKDMNKYYPAKVIDGDTMAVIKLRPVVIMPKPVLKTRRQIRRYNRLVYNIKKVYPYAKLINYYYYQIEMNLREMDSEKEREEYLKYMEKYLRKKFEKQLVNLTVTQGKLLVKLVDRETDNTTYDLIVQFKGKMSANFWYTVGIVFGNNIKTEYNPQEEDRYIEYIITQIENGRL